MTGRMTITDDPFIHHNQAKPWREWGNWPCSWISCPAASSPPFVTAYHLHFTLQATADIRIHVTADERYDLFLDGQRIGRGSERGDPNNWFFESYILNLDAGQHTLAARVWSLGDLRPFAEMSVSPGFLLCAEGDWGNILSTGVAPWQSKILDGFQFAIPPAAFWRGARMALDGHAYDWDYQQGTGTGWQPCQVNKPGISRVYDLIWHDVHRLQPATLPPMLERTLNLGTVRHVQKYQDVSQPVMIQAADHLPDEAAQWQGWLLGNNAVVIPPHTSRRVIIDMGQYYCLYPELLVSDGDDATIRLHSAESTFLTPSDENYEKGHRDVIEGTYFIGYGDSFVIEGGPLRSYDTLWWQAGRYWELIVETQSQSLELHAITLTETRYPLEMGSRFHCDDTRLENLLPIMLRSLQLTCHETYYDAPYYEEMAYAADARLEMLCTYIVSQDKRLPRKTIHLFDSSRLENGLTQARYPSWEKQLIAPFALWWVAMVHDYAYWTDDRDFVLQMLSGVRMGLEGYHRYVDDTGLVRIQEGWNFMDWLTAWPDGVPPQAVDGYNALLNWHYIYILTLAVDLEEQLGESEFAQLWRRRANNLAERVIATFWDEKRGLMAEDLDHQYFSEHTQALALLSGHVPEPYQTRMADGLLHDPELFRTTYYFSHYLFEAYRQLNQIDTMFSRLGDWFSLPERGLKTTIERPEPSRSDCHAWAAHPLFHYFATILGIRPSSPGFKSVDIHPQLGHLNHAEGMLVHPQGRITVDFRKEGGLLRTQISLPEGVTGTLHIGQQTIHFTNSFSDTFDVSSLV
ncbi:MAG: alpha-L-rhamnosidase [Anaerolineae bacterium]|nr:alpha-L-rhamnosidase [Anaerolineae bacterium]